MMLIPHTCTIGTGMSLNVEISYHSPNMMRVTLTFSLFLTELLYYTNGKLYQQATSLFGSSSCFSALGEVFKMLVLIRDGTHRHLFAAPYALTNHAMTLGSEKYCLSANHMPLTLLCNCTHSINSVTHQAFSPLILPISCMDS